MTKLKLVIVLVVIALVITVLVQNAWQAQMRVLFWHTQLPGTALILVALLVGFALGLVTQALWRGRKPPQPKEPPKEEPEKK